jgi:hypothetical protein
MKKLEINADILAALIPRKIVGVDPAGPIDVVVGDFAEWGDLVNIDEDLGGGFKTSNSMSSHSAGEVVQILDDGIYVIMKKSIEVDYNMVDTDEGEYTICEDEYVKVSGNRLFKIKSL